MTDAQFDATVGKQNNGLSISFATYLHVSQARPPPTAKIMSAFLTTSMSINALPFS